MKLKLVTVFAVAASYIGISSGLAAAQTWQVGPNPDRMGPDRETLVADLRQDGRSISVRAHCSSWFSYGSFADVPSVEFNITASSLGFRIPVRTNFEPNLGTGGGFVMTTNIRIRTANGDVNERSPTIEDDVNLNFMIYSHEFSEPMSATFPMLLEIDYAGNPSIIEIPETMEVVRFFRGCIAPSELASAESVQTGQSNVTRSDVESARSGTVLRDEELLALQDRYLASVTRVSSGDTLNARSGPGTDFRIVREYSSDTRFLYVAECTGEATREEWFSLTESGSQPTGTWCQVADNLELLIPVGWVNAWYLLPEN